MSRNLMPKSGAMAPYVVVNRDAAVAGVFSIDGEAGAVVLTSKYLQISKYNTDKAATDASINSINESIGNINTALGGINTTLNTKAAKGANNDITELNALTKAIKISQGGTGATTLDGAKKALQVERLRQQSNGTFIVSPNEKYSLFIYDSGDFGLIESSTAAVQALKVAFGGTGGTTPKAARKNLNVPVGALAEVIPNGENVLNYIAIAGQSGYYSSGDGVTHIPPVTEGWWTYNFHCHGVDINGAAQYGMLKATGLSGSTWTNVLDGTGNWKGWQEQFNSQSTVPVANGGTGANSIEGAKTKFGINRFSQTALDTRMSSPDAKKIFRIADGVWGAYNLETNQEIPLGIASGGTGANSAAQARRNLELSEWGLLQSISGRYPGGFNIDSIDFNSTLTVPPSPGSNIVGVRPFQQIPGLEDAWFFLETLVHPDPNYRTQRATLFTGAWKSSICTRTMDSGTWGVWQQVHGAFGLIADPIRDRATFKSMGIADGGAGSLVGGTIKGGAFTAWRDRPCGVLVEHEATDAAYAIWKSVKWGVDWVSGMDAVLWAAGGAQLSLYCKGAEYRFDSGGTAAAGQWVSTSDIRMKANLKEIENARDKVKSLVGYTYYKRSTLKEEKDTTYNIEAGVIAQDVQAVLPEAVYKIEPQKEDSMLGVSHAGVNALLVNAFNELNEVVEKQQQEIDELKELVKQLLAK
ncbi:L-shaped tail fiber protein B [Escherichia phage EscoHU1]|uniref:L-shaped tail fiber protein B n=1 Tax=Escherichia phage EscoHU1 TaxID=2881221 RepID=A0AAD1P014_9CAUD|nr:L-shaped tail fiber protein B [Escherichia phage EscoHU1]